MTYYVPTWVWAAWLILASPLSGLVLAMAAHAWRAESSRRPIYSARHSSGTNAPGSGQLP